MPATGIRVLASEHLVPEEAISETDQIKFDRLFSGCRDSLAKLVSRLTAWSVDDAHVQDILQDTVLRAWLKRHTFRGDSSFETWITGIAINCCRNHYRSLRIAREFYQSWIAQRQFATERDYGVGTSVDQSETNELVRTAIAQLSHRDREVIVLRYLQEYAIQEMAELLKIKRASVDARLSRARKRLAQILRPLGVNER